MKKQPFLPAADAQAGEGPVRLQVDRLRIEIYPDRQRMGVAAAWAVARAMQTALARQSQVAMAFAAAPSQNQFLAALTSLPGVDWPRIAAFQLDEYVGLPPAAPQRFAAFLRSHLFDHVRPGVIHALDGNARDLAQECGRYARLLARYPPEIACIGVGQNGHVAFNEPDVADFDDEQWVKVVELDPRSRRQQVQDGCFPAVEEVPRRALTLTMPAVMAFKQIYCVVPSAEKAQAIREMLRGPVSPGCPASILRCHPQVTLYLDRAAAGL
ncbi:MAG: glucosamine-6-phosphate deaminase [Ardenticatenaceae bacterium]|nr:glucosamine-6-phosphate deaminase [Ardenticatenaceae bacterium]